MGRETQALVIAAHGSHRNPDSALPAYEHADRIRETGSFDEVRTAFWKEEPAFREIRRTVVSDTLFVVPLFMSEGYFSDRILPRELGRDSGQARDGESDVIITDPIGTHPTIADVVINRAQTVTGDPGVGPGTALAVVGHGTERHDESATSTWDHVASLRDRGRFDEVSAFFLDEPPYVDEIGEAFTSEEIVVVPLFVADGYHTTDDIPRALGGSGGGIPDGSVTIGDRTLWYSGAVGTDPRMADVILERAREAGATTDQPNGTGQATSPGSMPDIDDALVERAAAGVCFDGFRVRKRDGSYTVTTADGSVSHADQATLTGVLEDHHEHVTDWYHWTHRVERTNPHEYAFLRWLERADEWDVRDRYDRLRTGIRREWGELRIRTTLGEQGTRVYTVRHRDDEGTPAEELTAHRHPSAVRAVVRFDECGRYRPLKSAPTLPAGWRVIDLGPGELVRTVEFIYPASIANWHLSERGELDVSQWRETAARQTGMYEVIGDLDAAAVDRATRACCTDDVCLKRRHWEYDADRPLDVPAGEGLIPCREPCSFLVAAAREWALLEDDSVDSDGLGPNDRGAVVAILEALADDRLDDIGPGEFDNPANRFRLRYLRERLRDRGSPFVQDAP